MFDNNNGLTALWEFGFLFLFLGVLVLYYFSQYSLMKAIQPENRYIEPGYVFLQIIPLFGSIYAFSVNTKIANSIRLEADNREVAKIGEDDLLGNINTLSNALIFQKEYRPTYEVGRAKCVLGVCRVIPVVGSLAAVAWLVFLIIYWVKVVKVKNIIQAS